MSKAWRLLTMTTFINLNENPQNSLTFSKPGDYVVFFHNISGKLNFEIEAEGTNVYIYGLFTGKDADQYHIETIQHHKVGNSFSDLLIKGVFEDKAKLIYQGLIRIEKGAQQSHAYQKNQNLVLSKDAFVDSRPFLEILANDVFCTHGSTTGKLNKEQIFYAKSRGLTQKEAEKLLVEGFISELYSKVQEKVPAFERSF